LAIGPFLILGLYLSFYTKEFLLQVFGYPEYQMTGVGGALAYTIVLFVARDFVSFIVHWAMHHWPILWRFHQVHHSAEVLNPVTQYRIHPVELVINNFSNLLVIGLVTGIFDFLASGKLPLWEILGVNGFTFLFLAIGANLRHSHVKFTYPSFLEKFIISPVQHQIHHSDSPEHFNRNLGSALAIWDRIFGTLLLSRDVQRLRFGLGKNGPQSTSFWENLWVPFVSKKNPNNDKAIGILKE
jgi:sterol desaturase/sphingolipid hydroxylase (fatty acid hydroxylase superfamily)